MFKRGALSLLNGKYIANTIVLSYTANHCSNMVNWQQREIRSIPEHNKI